MIRLLITRRYFVALIWMLGCYASVAGCKEEDCQDSECYNFPRVCVEILPFVEEPPVCDQVSITYSHDEWSDMDDECGTEDSEQWGPLNPTSCYYGSESITVTISQDEQRTATRIIELAEHNYCGEDIAYVVVTLHEVEPPTFGETLYVSPCENGGL